MPAETYRVLALPRGGVPVAHEVATALGAPLDVFLVRKLGVPGHGNGDGRDRVRRHQCCISIRQYSASRASRSVIARAQNLRHAAQTFVGDRPPVPVTDRVVILIDDGLATGATMEAAVAALRIQSPTKIVIAVPVGPIDTCNRFTSIADETLCLFAPSNFRAVGEWYDNFDPTSDEEVKALLL